jgi:hypothetical protein
MIGMIVELVRGENGGQDGHLGLEGRREWVRVFPSWFER